MSAFLSIPVKAGRDVEPYRRVQTRLAQNGAALPLPSWLVDNCRYRHRRLIQRHCCRRIESLSTIEEKPAY